MQCPNCRATMEPILVPTHSGRTDYKCPKCGSEYIYRYDSLTGGFGKLTKKEQGSWQLEDDD